MSASNFLGRGSYGSVEKQGNLAKKKFSKTSHLVQEYLALKYLSSYDHLVKVVKVDFANKELYMRLHQMNMRDWLGNHGAGKNCKCLPTDQNKLNVIDHICRGVYVLHKLGLVHGDLKPSNVLIDCVNNNIKATIADLGFVSLERFAKVERTAEVYRDIVVHHSITHDIYSLAIIILEMFGHINLEFQPRSYEQLHRIIDKKIKDKSFAVLLISMTDADYNARPSIELVYEKLFGKKLTKEIKAPNTASLCRRGITIESQWNDKIDAWMEHYSQVNNLNREKRGYYALIKYFSDAKTKPEEYKLYTASMLFILSSIFRRSNNFTIDNALYLASNYGDYNRNDVLTCFDKLLTNMNVVNILMSQN